MTADPRVAKLPQWAQHLIAALEERARRAEATLPWTEPGMEWSTIVGHDAETRLFTLDRDGAHQVCVLYKGDRLFVGRAKR